MTNSEKIIEVNAEELGQIYGGLDGKNKKIINTVGTIEIVLGGVIGGCLGAVAGNVWVKEAVKSGKDIGQWGDYWRRILSLCGGFKVGTDMGYLLATVTRYLGGLMLD